MLPLEGNTHGEHEKKGASLPDRSQGARNYFNPERSYLNRSSAVATAASSSLSAIHPIRTSGA